MKKVLMLVLAILISVAFVTTVFAQTATDKATKAATDAGKDKAKAAADTTKDKAIKAATEKPAAPADKAKTEKPAVATEKKVEKKEAKPKVHQFTGEVTAIDMTAKTLNAKNKKGDKVFDITAAEMKAEPKAGDKVLVKYTEKDGKNIANSVTVTKKAAVKKEAPKKDEKAAAPAPAPAKAAAPAPAKK